MRLNILDPNTFELLNVLTLYESVQWSPTFNTDSGSFEIDCSINYFDFFQEELLIENTEDSEHIGVIKQITTTRTYTKDSLKVKGVFLEKDILDRRIINGIYTYNDISPTVALYNLISLNLYNPVDESRKINGLGKIVFPDDSEIADLSNINFSCTYSSLSEEVFGILQDKNLGIKVKFNETKTALDIVFYTGTDRTEGSDDALILSRDRGTALSVEYSKDSSENVTNLYAIGEDNTIVNVEKTVNGEKEPKVESSIDISSEVPWPTYSVEKPEEDGGQYFRYKKATPEGYVTNQDIWEQWNVERIETETTYTRQVPVTPEDTTIIDGDALEETNPNMNSNYIIDASVGVVVGGVVSSSILSSLKNKTSSKASKVMSQSEGETESKKTLLGYVVNLDLNAVKPTNGLSLNKTVSEASSVPVLKTSNSKTANSRKDALNKVPIDIDESVISEDKLILGSDTVHKIEQVEDSTTGEVTTQATEMKTEEYTVTTVTYEDRDFNKYVYVNPGDPPSKATKIIEGSVGSGNVMYYENFEDVRYDISIYKEQLLKKASDYLNTFVLSETVDVEIYTLAHQKYKEDYSLGDIVTCKDKEVGFAVDNRITSVTETWDSKGHSVTLTLGDNVPSLTNRIKLISKGGN